MIILFCTALYTVFLKPFGSKIKKYIYVIHFMEIPNSQCNVCAGVLLNIRNGT